MLGAAQAAPRRGDGFLQKASDTIFGVDLSALSCLNLIGPGFRCPVTHCAVGADTFYNARVLFSLKPESAFVV